MAAQDRFHFIEGQLPESSGGFDPAATDWHPSADVTHPSVTGVLERFVIPGLGEDAQAVVLASAIIASCDGEPSSAEDLMVARVTNAAAETMGLTDRIVVDITCGHGGLTRLINV